MPNSIGAVPIKKSVFLYFTIPHEGNMIGKVACYGISYYWHGMDERWNKTERSCKWSLFLL